MYALWDENQNHGELMPQTAQTDADIHRRIQELTAVNRMFQAINTTLEPRIVIERALDEILDSVEPDLCMLYLLEDGRLEPKGRRVTDDSISLDTHPHKVGRCLCGLAALTGEPVYSPNIHEDQRCCETSCKEAGFVSFAALPLVSQGNVLGIIGVASREPRDFARRSDFFESIAGAVSSGLHNARLHDDLKARADELEGVHDRISQALQEKNVLLKEVHHRVKNNLQIVNSLISLQASRLRSDATRALFDETCGRIRTMALVHEELYRSDDLARVRLDSFVQKLLPNLAKSFGNGEVRMVSDIPPIALLIERAVPLGLLINEAVTNSLKHAFPDGAGRISVVADQQGTELTIRIADDGLGLPPGLQPDQSETLGLQLIHTLADQLGSPLRIEGPPGTAYVLSFQRQAEA